MKTEQFDYLTEIIHLFLEDLSSFLKDEFQYSAVTSTEILEEGRRCILELVKLIKDSSMYIDLLEEPDRINTEGICFKIDSDGLTIKVSTHDGCSRFRHKLNKHIKKNYIYFQKIAEQELTVFKFILETAKTYNQLVIGFSYYDVRFNEQWLYLYDLNYYNPVYSLELVSGRSLEKNTKFSELYETIPITQSSISEREFSVALGMKLGAFQKLFQQQTGSTLHQYHQKRRLIELTKLVFFSDKTISEIICHMGYNSYNSAYKRIQIRFKISFRKIARFVRNTNIFKF